MRGLTRLLFMFGPMLLRQFQKYQRNKQRQQYQQPNRPPMRQEAPRRRKQPAPPPPPEMTEEEKNFRLKEEDIMLDKNIVKEYTGKQSASHEIEHDAQPALPSTPTESVNPKPAINEEEIVPSGKEKKDDNGFDLKDLFFEDEDEEKKS